MLTETLNRLFTRRSLGHQPHIRLVIDHRRDAFPHQCVVVDAENSNALGFTHFRYSSLGCPVAPPLEKNLELRLANHPGETPSNASLPGIPS